MVTLLHQDTEHILWAYSLLFPKYVSTSIGMDIIWMLYNDKDTCKTCSWKIYYIILITKWCWCAILGTLTGGKMESFQKKRRSSHEAWTAMSFWGQKWFQWGKVSHCNYGKNIKNPLLCLPLIICLFRVIHLCFKQFISTLLWVVKPPWQPTEGTRTTGHMIQGSPGSI